MSIVEKCKEPLNPVSHNSYRLFNTNNMQGTTHSKTPELDHQQILEKGADNIYRCVVNLPWSFVRQFEIIGS